MFAEGYADLDEVSPRVALWRLPHSRVVPKFPSQVPECAMWKREVDELLSGFVNYVTLTTNEDPDPSTLQQYLMRILAWMKAEQER